MEVELKKYLDERKIENYAAKRKRIEEEKSSKEDYVKIIAYQTLIGIKMMKRTYTAMGF